MGYVKLGRCKENRRWRQGGRTAGPAVYELSQPSKSAMRKTSQRRVEGEDRGGGGRRQGRVEEEDKSDDGHVDEKFVMREVWD